MTRPLSHTQGAEQLREARISAIVTAALYQPDRLEAEVARFIDLYPAEAARIVTSDAFRADWLAEHAVFPVAIARVEACLAGMAVPACAEIGAAGGPGAASLSTFQPCPAGTATPATAPSLIPDQRSVPGGQGVVSVLTQAA